MVRAVIIVEMAGKPPNHVKESLKKHMDSLKELKDVEVLSIQVSEPKLVKNSKSTFGCFSKAEIEVSNLFKLSEIVFNFMPSFIEVVDPPKVQFSAQEATAFLNSIAGRLHHYDDILKLAHFKMKEMDDKLKEREK